MYVALRVKSLNVHPGEIIRKEYLVPLDMSANALARLFGSEATAGALGPDPNPTNTFWPGRL